MLYKDGQPVLLGDVVDVGGGWTGVVVAVLDSDLFSPEYASEQWSYLKEGALVMTDGAGLVQYPTSEYDFELVRRA